MSNTNALRCVSAMVLIGLLSACGGSDTSAQRYSFNEFFHGQHGYGNDSVEQHHVDRQYGERVGGQHYDDDRTCQQLHDDQHFDYRADQHPADV